MRKWLLIPIIIILMTSGVFAQTTITKGLIGEEDQNYWDGVTPTFSRVTSSGGHITLHKVGNEVDVLMAYGGGIHYTSTAINAALTAIGTKQATLMLSPGDWVISSDVVFTQNISLDMSYGAKFVYSGGAVSGLFEAIPEWWGDNTVPGTTDMATSIQYAIDSVYYGGTVYLQGKYRFGSKILVNKKMTMRGPGNVSEIINAYPGASLIKASTLNDTGLQVTGNGVLLDGFLVDGETGNGGIGIVVEGNNVHLRDMSVFRQGGIGIKIGIDGDATNANSFNLDHVNANNNGSHGIYINSNSIGSPNANAGVFTNVVALLNGGDGVRVGNAWMNDFWGVVTEQNTGWGMHLTIQSLYNRVHGGDQDEINGLGAILNEGNYNFFFGTSEVNFTDNGTSTSIFTGTILKTRAMGKGAWRPGIAFGNDATGVIYDYTGTRGMYSFYEDRVEFNGMITLTSKGSATGAVTITGLPYVSANDITAYSPISLVPSGITFSGQISGAVRQNGTDMVLYQTTEAGVLSQLTNTNFANNSVILVSGSYTLDVLQLPTPPQPPQPPANTDVTPTVTISDVKDDFNRTNENPLTITNWYGSPWTVWGDVPLQVVSNAAQGTEGYAFQGNVYKNTSSINMEVAAPLTVLPASGSYAVLLARHVWAAHTGYELELHMTSATTAEVKLYKWTSSTSQPVLDNKTYNIGTVAAGDVICLQVIGSTIAGWINHGAGWVKIGSSVDTSYAAAGLAGIGLGEFSGNVATFTDFRVKALP